MSRPGTIRLIAVLLLTVLLVLSCARSRSGEPAPLEDERESSGAGTGVAGDRRAEDRDERPDGAADTVPLRLTDQGRERAAASVAQPADPKDTAFEADRLLVVPLYPMDTVLGRLARPDIGSARDRAALSTAGDLLRGLIAGELDRELVSPDMGPGGRAALERLLRSGGGLKEVRLGSVTDLPGGEASVPFRLFGDHAHVIGEVVVAKLGDEWYTSDIQVEVLDRNTTLRFYPGSVRPGGNL